MNPEASASNQEAMKSTPDNYREALRVMGLRPIVQKGVEAFKGYGKQDTNSTTAENDMRWIGLLCQPDDSISGLIRLSKGPIPIEKNCKDPNLVPRVTITKNESGEVSDAKPATLVDADGKINPDIQANSFRIIEITDAADKKLVCTIAHADGTIESARLTRTAVVEAFIYAHRKDLLAAEPEGIGKVYLQSIDSDVISNPVNREAIEKEAQERYITGESAMAFITMQIQGIDARLAKLTKDEQSEERKNLERLRMRLDTIQEELKTEPGPTGKRTLIANTDQLARAVAAVAQYDTSGLHTQLDLLRTTVSTDQYAALENMLTNPQETFAGMLEGIQDGTHPENAAVINKALMEGNSVALQNYVIGEIQKRIPLDDETQTQLKKVLEKSKGPATMVLLLALLGMAMAGRAAAGGGQ